MPSEFIISSIFLLIGVGVLLPWNAFISAKPYFDSRLCQGSNNDADTNNIHKQSSQNVELWFGVVYNSSAVLALSLILLGQWILERRQLLALEAAVAEIEDIDNAAAVAEEVIPNDVTLRDNEYSNEPNATSASRSPDNSLSEEANERQHSFWMVRLPLSVYLTVFFATALVVVIPSIPPSIFLQFTLSTLALCGPGACIGNAGILATAGLFPARVGINPFFQGQAVGGVAVALANFVAASLQDSDQFQKSHCNGPTSHDSYNSQQQEQVNLYDTSHDCVPYTKTDWITFTYFGLGSAVLIACLIGYGYIEKYHHQTQYHPVQDPTEEITSSIRGIELHDEAVREDHPGTLGDGPNSQDGRTLSHRIPRRRSTGTRTVWLAISGPAVAIFLTYVVTLALFPSWTSTLRSAHQCKSTNRLLNDLYTPLTFIIFNGGDLLGRFIAPLVPIERFRNLSQLLVLASCLRFLFFVLFLSCESGASRLDKFELGSDLYSFIVQILFAVSNGLLVSVAFMHGSGLVPATTTIQQKVSEWLNLAVGGGLLVGSLLSFPFARIATGHW